MTTIHGFIRIIGEALSPLMFVGAGLVLLALTLWIGSHARRSLRVILATASAPVADTRATIEGLVRLRGTAQPSPPPAGYQPSSVVWRSRSSGRRINSRSQSTTSRTVGWILVEDQFGRCAVDAERASFLTTRSESVDEPMFNEGQRWDDQSRILRGDTVIAIGTLRRGSPRGDGAPPAQCELVPYDGILIVAATPDRYVQIVHGIWLGLRLVPLCLVVSFLGTLVFGHIASYPNAGFGRFATFVSTLLSDPMKFEPGLTHPRQPSPPYDEPSPPE